MSTTSTVVTVKAQIVTQLTAQLSTDNVVGDDGNKVVCLYSHPGQEMGMDAVFLGDTRDGRHQIANMRAGRKPRNEEYLQEVVFECARVGPDATLAEAASFAAFASLENLLANDPKAGLTSPTPWVEVAEWHTQNTWDAGTSGWRCKLTADLLVRARLT